MYCDSQKVVYLSVKPTSCGEINSQEKENKKNKLRSLKKN